MDSGEVKLYRGVVSRIIYSSLENPNRGFWIVDVKCEDMDPISVRGNASAYLTIGMKVAFSASESEYRGEKQLEAIFINPDVEITNKGAHGWLRTQRTENIGPMRSRAIRDAFPDNLHEALNDPEMLKTVEGISNELAQALHRDWKLVELPNSVLEAFGIGEVPTSVIKRVIDHYGGGEIESIMRGNPWLLAREISGISLKMADKIAEALGVDMESDERYRAVVMHTLEHEISLTGHTQISEKLIGRAAFNVGKIPVETIERTVNEMIAEGEIIKDAASGMLASPSIYGAEERIVKNIHRLKDSFVLRYEEKEILDLISESEKELGLTLDVTQRNAALLCLMNGVSIMTGGPGTGKSTTQGIILSVLKKMDGEIIMLGGPTARAAKKLEEATKHTATTIHRALVMDGMTGQFTYNRDNPLSATTVIIDEFSMVDTSLCKHLFDAIASRARLIIVGDSDQLPSVGAGQVLWDMVRSEALPVARLSVIHRQAEGSAIISGSQAILKGEMPEFNDTDFQFIERKTDREIHEEILRVIREETVQEGYSAKDGVLVVSPQKKGSLGTKRLNEVIKDEINPGDENDLARNIEIGNTLWTVGDKVMHTRNDYDNLVFNGDIGYVLSVDHKDKPANAELIVEYPDGHHVTYTKSNVSQLTHAWASTIHKAQGDESPIVIMICSTEHSYMLERALIYTGETRTKLAFRCVGQKIAFQAGIKRTNSTRRNTGLCSRLREMSGLTPAFLELPAPEGPSARPVKRQAALGSISSIRVRS